MSLVGTSWIYLSLAGVRRVLPSLAGSSGQRRGRRGFSSKHWEIRSPSLALPLSPLARHGQVPLPPAPSGTWGSDTLFCPSRLQQGWVLPCCSGTSCGEVGWVWERPGSVLPRSVKRWVVIYAHSKDSLKHPIFMVSPPAASLFPPRVTSCLSAL